MKKKNWKHTMTQNRTPHDDRSNSNLDGIKLNQIDITRVNYDCSSNQQKNHLSDITLVCGSDLVGKTNDALSEDENND